MKNFLVPVALLMLCVCAGCPATAPRPPAAEFAASPAGGYAPLSVQFEDLSTPGSAPITQYFWNFGDSQTSTEASPLHTYNSVGRFTVTLRVVSSAGEGITSKEKLIEVLQPLNGPEAHFSAAPQSGSAPLTVQFSDDSAPGDRPITTWRWDFGDGGRSTQQDPSHTYSATGKYTVSLTVANSLGEDTFTEAALISVFD